MENIRKLANIKFTIKEYEEIKKEFFNSNKRYIIKYKTIYQLFFSPNAGLYSQKIYTNETMKDMGYTRKGRFVIVDGELVNKLVGFELLNVKKTKK